LYQEWWVGHWAAFLSAEGIFDNSPLKSFLNSELKKLGLNDASTFSRNFEIGFIDFMKGTFFSVNQTTDFKGYKDIVDTLFGSFSFPGFFSPTQAFSSHYIEGSSVRSLDVISAINYCLNQGFAE